MELNIVEEREEARGEGIVIRRRTKTIVVTTRIYGRRELVVVAVHY
jgi:hypothetical protein